MKKTAILLMVFVMMLCTLGSTVVLAADPPVITDAYIGGFPVVGEVLHVVADGTYDGKDFLNAQVSEVYQVTATYAWEYGSGDSWTAASPANLNSVSIGRACKVTSAMAGQYVRCTITPKAGGESGTPVTVTFPGTMMLAAEANWKTTLQRDISFTNASDVALFDANAGITLSHDATEGAMKITNWSATGTKWDAATNKLTSAQIWNLKAKDAVIKCEKRIDFKWKERTEAGSTNNFQSGFEPGFSYSVTMTNLEGGVGRKGTYGNASTNTSWQTRSVRNTAFELIPNSYYYNAASVRKILDANGIVSPSMMVAETKTNFWNQAPTGGTVFTGVSAIYVDDVQVVESTIPYTVTATAGVGGAAEFATKEVDSGETVAVKFIPEPGKKVASLTVNGQDAMDQLSGSTVTLKNIYQNINVAATFEPIEIDHISLQSNPVYYKGTDRAASPVLLTAHDGNGNTADVTGLPGVTYASSNEDIFSFTAGNLLKSNGKVGYSSITATYQGKTVGIIMFRTDGTEASMEKSSMGTNYKVAPGGLAGRDGGQAYYTDKTVTADHILRIAKGRGNWGSTSKLRVTSGWFYDDAVSNYNAGVKLWLYDAAEKTSNFAATYSYGQFDWSGATASFNSRTEVRVQGGGATTPTHYSCAGAVTSVPRTKGWHQAWGVLYQNPSAPMGWSVRYYIDGVLVRTENMTKLTDAGKDSYLECRTLYPASTSDDIYYYDDFVLAGAVTDKIVSVKHLVDANGTVKVNNIEKENDHFSYVNSGDSLSATILPDAGYEIDQVTYGGTAVTPNAFGVVTLSNVTAEGAVLDVTFKERATTAPEISGDDTYNYFKVVSGQPTAYVYGKLNNFYVPGGTTADYGIKLWVAGDPENALTLPAMTVGGTPAVPQADTAFAIKVFGEAIIPGTTYEAKHYIGESESEDVIILTCEEK